MKPNAYKLTPDGEIKDGTYIFKMELPSGMIVDLTGFTEAMCGSKTIDIDYEEVKDEQPKQLPESTDEI